MQRITCRIEFVTPAFIGGSDSSHCELTGSTVRGQLRWWFRAVAGGYHDGNVVAVTEAERQVFGSSERRATLRVLIVERPGSTRAAFPAASLGTAQLLNFAGAPVADRPRLHLQHNGNETRTRSLAYLGYGPVGMNGVAQRDYISPAVNGMPGGTAAFALQGAPVSTLFFDALWAWLHLGAVGSRSRRGFGSIRCKLVEGSLPIDAPGLTVARVADFDAAAGLIVGRNRATTTLAEWSHISPDTHVYRSILPADTWQDAMNLAAAWLIAFRRRYGMGTGRDYDWMKGPVASRQVPDRAGFGLPLPFGKGATVNWLGHRRASPILLRVSRFDEGYFPVFTHFPSRLVPNGENITVGVATAAAPFAAQQAIVGNFLNELCARGKAQLVV